RRALAVVLLGEAHRHAAADGTNAHQCHESDDQPPARQYLCHHAPSATAGLAVPVHLTSRPGLAEPAALRSFVPEVPFFVPWRAVRPQSCPPEPAFTPLGCAAQPVWIRKGA